MSLLPPKTTLAIFASHKLGHVMQCEGIARALGVGPDIRLVRPRKLFHWMAPWGPPDFRDLRNRPNSALRKPYPDIALASGRETVPYLRALKRLSRGKSFCVYLGDPRTAHDTFDLICLPEHDSYRGKNVVPHITPPHSRDEAARASARARPDERVASLPTPRVALFIGGSSASYFFTERDIEAIAGIARTVLASGASMMVSPSRRTPPKLLAKIRQAVGDNDRLFIWDGTGGNPYVSMLALAESFIVTADSVNMISEAVATGRPVQIYEPTGHAGKFMHFIGQLIARHAIRRWEGKLENWSYTPVDSTPVIAREIAKRYGDFLAGRK